MSISAFRYALATAIAGPGTPQMVQHAGFGNNTTTAGAPAGNGFHCKLMHPIGQGNLLRRTFSYPHGLTASVADDNGNSWVKVQSVDPGAITNGLISEYWVAKNCNAGVTTVTVTLSSTSSIFIGGDLTEYANVDTVSPVDGSIGTASVTAPNLATGSFTPSTNNDANGGHLIDCYFACNNSLSSDNPSLFTPGGSFQLLTADVTFITSGGSPHATQFFTQTTNASINPGVTATGSTDSYNCIAVALKAANAGTLRPAGMRILKEISYTGNGGTNVPMQIPMHGNLGLITCATDVSTFTGCTDSDGKTWTNPSGLGLHKMFYLDQTSGAGVSNSKKATIAGTNSGGTISFRFVDFIGAATTPFDSVADVEAQNGGNRRNVPSGGGSATYSDAPIMTPVTNGTGMTVAIEYAVTGPCRDCVSPTGSSYFSLDYPQQTDVDLIDNSDGFAGLAYTSNTAQHWNWTVEANNSLAWGGAISFKSA